MTSYWQTRQLSELTHAEWESLCDGCARCCLVKLQNADTSEVHYTNIACKLLDTESCRCSDYANRKERVSECFVLSADNIGDYPYLPETCAYRRLHEGKELPPWHPLVSGDPDTVRQAGISICGKVVSEQYVHADELQDHIVTWPTDE
jgi:uncharacterized cysteine cluster protein YcgN (CxxCxxCC family)